MNPGNASWVVTQKDLASELAEPGEAFPEVFSTSRMIAMMELAASRVLQSQLGPGELSVGVRVNVEHTAPTPVGVRVKAEARFLRKEGKLYAFEVQAWDEAGEIGRGTHHRAIVQTSRLLAGAQRRRSPSMDSGT